MEALEQLFLYAVAGSMMLLFAYALVRVGSWAYFRTKLEHFRQVMREIDPNNDEEGGRR